MKPYQESAENRYCRLLPPSTCMGDHAALSALGCAMMDDGSRVSEVNPEILPEVGYTYFGQFIAHDLTRDHSSVDDVWRKEPQELENSHLPKLNLEVLYGRDQTSSTALYEQNHARLKIGAASERGRSFDVCTGGQGELVVADDRSGANVILREMTAVFARLHNFAVEQFRSTGVSDDALFERARRQTQWQYQWLVVKDYLPTLLKREVYRKVFTESKPTVHWDTFSIPVEFSVAAMRFGHAMVRPNYLFSLGQEMFLPRIFGRTTDRGALDQDLEIDWGLFFQGAGSGAALTARPIDTRLSPPLHELPSDLTGAIAVGCPHFRIKENPLQLPVRTLLRGAGLRLASGQTAASAFGERVLTKSELTQNGAGSLTEQGKILNQSELIHETPLWYYILKESELRENGNKLGAVGSHVIAETIHAALRHDPVSYANRPEQELPPIWEFPDGPSRIFGLSELFRRAARL